MLLFNLSNFMAALIPKNSRFKTHIKFDISKCTDRD